ncbi:hypothetical protein FRB90_005526 [Tulasnella sp. 427]|nr:hypothetical protein FRB90_005526 [Tulasnella sp. 427]
MSSPSLALQDAMWSPSESADTSTSRDRRNPQRFRQSNFEDSQPSSDFQYDRGDVYSSTSASKPAAVMPPRRSLSYEDNLSAIASAYSAPLTASNTPIPSPSTLRTQRPLAKKRSNLTSSTPVSPTSRFIQSNSDNTLGPSVLRSPMSFVSDASSSWRPSGANSVGVAGSRRSSAARSPDSAAAAAAALAASKHDMKRMLAKPAPTASSFGSSSAGSVGILSAAIRTEDDDVFGNYSNSPTPQDIDPLAYGSSVDTTLSYLKDVNPDMSWSSDSPGLGIGIGGNGANNTSNNNPSAATRTRSRNESSTSNSAALPRSQSSQQPTSTRTQVPHRARALTQASTMTATTTNSSSAYHPPSSAISHSNTSYFADYSVDSHSASSSSRSRVPPPIAPNVTFPVISDDVAGGSLSYASKGASPGGPPRALTPASAIAYAYQHRGSGASPREFDSSARPSLSPSPNPSFYTASSPSASESGRAYGFGESEYYHHRQQQQHQQYLNTPFASARTLAGSPISPTSGRVVSNGDPDSGALGNGVGEKSRSASGGALRTLGRKVSGKFSRKARGNAAAGSEDAGGGVSSSVGTNEGSFLAMSSEFGGYDGDDSTGGGVGSAPGMAYSASSSSRGGSGRSRSKYDISARRSPSGYFGDANGAGLADVSSSSIDASFPSSPVSPPGQQPQQSGAPQPRPSKLTKTKSLLRLSQQNRSVTDPTPVPNPNQEPTTPGGTGVGNSIWKMVKKFSSSTLREKHRAGPSSEPVPPVPSLPPGVVSSGSVSRRSSVSDHDYGVVVGGGSFGGFGEGGERYSVSSGASKPKSETKRSIVGRSRSGTVISSAHSHGHGIPIRSPPPELPRSGPGHGHNRSLSQSRTTTTATLSSSPISSDLSSSRYFFGRQQSSPRTSTSSYLAYSDVQDYGPPPPLPVSQKQAQSAQHIVPPDEIYAAMLKYGDDLGGIGSGKEDDDSAPAYQNVYSSSASRKSIASSAPPPKDYGLRAPPSGRSTERSRSRDPPSSRKSSASGKGDPAPPAPPPGSGELQGRNPLASASSSSLSMAPVKLTKPKKVGNFQHPPLNMLRHRADNPAAARYVAVQATDEVSPLTVDAKTSPVKRTVFHKLMRSKSEVNLNPVPDTAVPPTPPTARPTPQPSADAKERRRTSPPVPSPSSPTKRWSIDERRGSAGSGNLLSSPSVPLSPARAASFDLQRSRPPSLSTTVMFRDITEVSAVKRSEDEKNRMWDLLLEKSEKAGGTLHAKIDSSLY